MEVQPALRSNLAGLSHDHLGQCCVRYLDELDRLSQFDKHSLSYDELKEWKKPHTYFGLLPYAAKNVFRHSNAAEGLRVLQKKFLRSFETGSTNLNRWVHTYNFLKRHLGYFERLWDCSECGLDCQIITKVTLLCIFSEISLQHHIKIPIDDQSK